MEHSWVCLWLQVTMYVRDEQPMGNMRTASQGDLQSNFMTQKRTKNINVYK